MIYCLKWNQSKMKVSHQGKRMKLISIKDYCKAHKISDSGARKRVSQKLVKSITLDEILYIVIEDTQPQMIKKLRDKIKLLNKDIKLLKEQKQTVINQDDYIAELKEEIKELRTEVKENRENERSLYEKVIGQYDRLMISN